MSISTKTHKMLWGRSGNRCAMPNCRRLLYEDETLTDDASLVGEEAHIVARSVDGPRGVSPLTTDERDKYDNLVLMCSIHHKQIDDQPNEFTVEKLHVIKQVHLDWVETSLNPNIDRQKDDEQYATYVDKWIELAGVMEWRNWTSFLLSAGQPQIWVSQYNNLKTLNEYLLSRVWPKRYFTLEHAFINFRVILNDFFLVFDKYKEIIGDGDNAMYQVEKIYKRLNRWNDNEYRRLGSTFDYNVDLVQDLVLELTRAANYVCSEIRRSIIPSFRIAEGLLLVESGPNMQLHYTTIKCEYASMDLEAFKYKGLRNLMEARENWDWHFGKGVNEDYFPFTFE